MAAHAEKSPSKKASADTKPKRAAAKSKDNADAYTKPELRDRIKEAVKAGDKGGRPGQWSARKAQLVASEYEKHGGGYTKGGPTSAQQHLQSWTEEKWQTADGKKAIKGKSTSRYLPKKAWDELTPAEKAATDQKKKAASKTGVQHVSNTAAGKKARKKATD